MIYGLILLVAASVATASVVPSPSCVCTRNYMPVCGSNGITYDNPCMLECAKTSNSDLSMAKTGRCPDDRDLCVCTLEYKPVCGSDGKTYPNKCTLNCQRSVRLVANNPCPQTESLVARPPCACTREAQPVCGSDGVTYGNRCLLNCSMIANPELHLKTYGPCDAAPQDISCACTRNLRPVCGSDGNTYNNICLLNCAKKNNPSLSIALRESCEGVNVVDSRARVGGCSCTRELAPVCASDGETYSSACIMRCRNPSAELVHEGPCEV